MIRLAECAKGARASVSRGSVDATPLVPVHIMGGMAYYHAAVRVLTNGNATAETVVDLASAVPPNALSSQIAFNWNNAGAGSENSSLRITPGQDFYRIDGGATTDIKIIITPTIPNISQRVFYINSSAAAAGTTIDIMGYRLPTGGD